LGIDSIDSRGKNSMFAASVKKKRKKEKREKGKKEGKEEEKIIFILYRLWAPLI